MRKIDVPGGRRIHAALEAWNKMVPTANIEEFYILVDLLRRFRPYGTTNQNQAPIEQAENVKYLIAKSLEIAMGTEVSATHLLFLDSVIAGKKGGSTGVSLNWDIALGRAVTYAYGPSTLDHGYESARPFKSGRMEQSRLTSDGRIYVPGKKFALYKLHGSSNWVVLRGVP